MSFAIYGNFNITGYGTFESYFNSSDSACLTPGFSQTSSLGGGRIIGFSTFSVGANSRALAYTPTVVSFSSDGDTWTQVPPPPVTINELTLSQPQSNVNPAAIVAANNSTIAFNPDVTNESWATVTLPNVAGIAINTVAANPNPVNANQPTYVVAGASGNIVYTWYTRATSPLNTSDWTQTSVDTGSPVTVQNSDYGAGSYQILTNDSVITTSNVNAGWTETVIPGASQLEDIAYDTNANTFTIVGNNNQIYQSNAMSNSVAYSSAANISPTVPANANIVSVSTQGGCTVATAVKEVAVGTIQSYLLKAVFGGIGGLIAGWAVSAVTANTPLSTSTCFSAKNILGTTAGTIFTSTPIPCSNVGTGTNATGGTTGTYSSYGQNWKYHTFTPSVYTQTDTNYTFTVTSVNPQYPYMDVLLVGGGGSGAGGGGGGGGVVYLQQETLAVGTYNLVAGGSARGAVYSGNSGGNTSITLDSGARNVYATGGGGGGEYSNGLSGGSGGGGGYGSNYGGGSGVAGQGYDGFRGISSQVGGGGGGAGGPAPNATSSFNNFGGPGLLNSITGSNVYYGNGGRAPYAGSGFTIQSSGNPATAGGIVIRYRNEAVVNTVATGGTISNVTIGNANYRIHTFSSNGTFSVANISAANPTCDILIVGGGGGSYGYYGTQASGYGGGGGGGAQVIYQPNISLSTGNYSVVVGLSAQPAGSFESFAANAQPSSCGLIPGAVAAPGGTGGTGSSGSGAGWGTTSNGGAPGTPGQGYAGGASGTGSQYGGEASAGGGGAGGPGANAYISGGGGSGSTYVGGDGGVGIINNITGSNVEYGAGGGGGGYSGRGGYYGAGGRTLTTPGSGGGGGNENYRYVQAGTAGTVIIRYQIC